MSARKGTLTTVYFVRHCQPEFSHRDDRTRPLTALGAEDGKAVRDVLHALPIDCFYSSPYLRSMQTIALAAEDHHLPIHTDERLRERQSGHGGNVGLTAPGDTPLRRRWADLSFHEPGGESLEQCQRRNVEALMHLLEQHAGKTLVIATHGTALSTILNHYHPQFQCEDFLRIVDWMPYIVELTFDGQTLGSFREIFHIERTFQEHPPV